MGQNVCLVSLTFHQRFFPSFYDLTRTLKLTIRAYLSLVLRVKASILSVRFFTKMARLNHGIILNQNTTLKTSWNIVGFNKQMFYLNYGYNVFWTVQEIQWKVFSGLSSNWKKNNLYCLNKLGRRELYQIQISEKYKKTQLRSCAVKGISTVLVSTGRQYIFYHFGDCRHKVKSFSVQNSKQYSFCE